MRYQHTDDLLGHAIEEAYYEICVLGEEMREAYDGTPEPLKDSAGRSREIAADLLEDASPPLVPAAVENQSITWIEKRPSPSRKLFRPARRDNATSALRSCIAFLGRLDTPDEATIRLRETLQQDADIFDSVFFPGMTGR
jgi:hypothetical protein